MPVLAIVLMLLVILLSCHGTALGDEKMVLPAESDNSDGPDESEAPPPETPGQYSPYSILGQFLKGILLVAVLGAGVYYFSKKLVPKLTTGQGKSVCVIETVGLGPHKSLHLLEIGQKQRLLVASTNETITLLADVTESVSEDSNS